MERGGDCASGGGASGGLDSHQCRDNGGGGGGEGSVGLCWVALVCGAPHAAYSVYGTPSGAVRLTTVTHDGES
jgi:hypothetical protein